MCKKKRKIEMHHYMASFSDGIPYFLLGGCGTHEIIRCERLRGGTPGNGVQISGVFLRKFREGVTPKWKGRRLESPAAWVSRPKAGHLECPGGSFNRRRDKLLASLFDRMMNKQLSLNPSYVLEKLPCIWQTHSKCSMNGWFIQLITEC